MHNLLVIGVKLSVGGRVGKGEHPHFGSCQSRPGASKNWLSWWKCCRGMKEGSQGSSCPRHQRTFKRPGKDSANSIPGISPYPRPMSSTGTCVRLKPVRKANSGEPQYFIGITSFKPCQTTKATTTI